MDKITHFELPFDDANRAQTFYKDLFDWKITAVPDMSYWIVHTGPTDENQMPKKAGFINGGMLKRDESSDPGSSHPVLVIVVKDCKEHCRKIVQAGGSIIREPTKVGDMGIYARFKDPEGNIMGLWQPLQHTDVLED